MRRTDFYEQLEGALPVAIVIILFQKHLVKGLDADAVKG